MLLRKISLILNLALILRKIQKSTNDFKKSKSVQNFKSDQKTKFNQKSEAKQMNIDKNKVIALDKNEVPMSKVKSHAIVDNQVLISDNTNGAKEVVQISIEAKRGPEKVKKFECFVCSKKFRSKDNMQLHRKIHEDKENSDKSKQKYNLNEGTILE